MAVFVNIFVLEFMSLKVFRELRAFCYFVFLSAKIARDVRFFMKAFRRVVTVPLFIEFYKTYGAM